MNLITWFLKTNEERMRASAMTYERSRASAAVVSPQQAYRSALEALAGTEARTLRSFNVALMLCAQSLSGTLPKPVVENILLNTHTWSMFQTRPDEADFVYPHVVAELAGVVTDSERRREFARQMQSLPCQQFYFLVKGQAALRCQTADVPPPSVAAYRTDEELLDIFDRHLAPTSMIPIHLAASLIAEWEADIVGQQQIRENPATPGPRSSGVSGGLDQLRRILNSGSESGK